MANEMEKNVGMPIEGNLGPYLRKARDDCGYSLRRVESETDGQVSNAYLSQLETGKIVRPSPNILYALSKAVNVEYDQLMLRAGYIVEPVSRQGEDFTPLKERKYVIENLTADEETELLRYLNYYRSNQV